MKLTKTELASIITEEIAKEKNIAKAKEIQNIILDEVRDAIREGFFDSIKGALGMGSGGSKKKKSLTEYMEEVIAAAEPLEPLGERAPRARGNQLTSGPTGFRSIYDAMSRVHSNPRNKNVAAAGNAEVLEADTKILEIVGMIEGAYAAASKAAGEAVKDAGDSAIDHNNQLNKNQAYQEILRSVPEDINKEFMYIYMSTKIYTMTYRNKHVLPYLKKTSPAGVRKAELARKAAKQAAHARIAFANNQELGRNLRLGMASRGL